MAMVEPVQAAWYSDWQNAEHARTFDARSRLNDRSLVLNFESFNDVRLLRDSLEPKRRMSLLEVGCATGEFYRYLRIRHPQVRYTGIDVSRPAIVRAKEKYGSGRFFLCRPEDTLRETLGKIGLDRRPEVIYSKDVIHHQTDPLGFLGQLVENASEALVFRTRTRDVGPTVWDPERSCQYHYGGWMPYIVLNLQELIDSLRGLAPRGELVVYRNPMILGGRENRFLPKECYLPETGTAETAIGIFRRSDRPNQVQVLDCRETKAAYPIVDRLAIRFRSLRKE